MIDNTHVVRAQGHGRDMVPVPGDGGLRRAVRIQIQGPRDWRRQPLGAGRGPLQLHREQLPGRARVSGLADANHEARIGATRSNATFSRALHASRRELFAAEKPCLKPLPICVPEVYVLHQRIVDAEGYVNVGTNRYTVPHTLIGRQLEVRETQERIEVFEGPRVVASWERVIGRMPRAHDRPGAPAAARPGPAQGAPPPEEELLLAGRTLAGRLRRGTEEARLGPGHPRAAAAAQAVAGLSADLLLGPRSDSGAVRPVRPRSTRANGARRSPTNTSSCRQSATTRRTSDE